MKTKQVKVMVEGIAGWARQDTLPKAIRKMVEYSRGYINPKKMTLEQFINELENQNIKIRLQVERNGEMANIAILGDEYNEAAMIEEW